MSSGIRNSGSNGSLQQFHLLAIQTTPPLSARKAFSKMSKEKESLFHWICKFVGRKKVGMLLLCLVSAAVFGGVLYVGKGEDSQVRDRIESIRLNNTLRFPGSSPTYMEQNNDNGIISSTQNYVESNQSRLQPPAFFTGYTLPPGNPCETFTLPPPPADKKRTGPRPCPVCYLPVEEAIALMPNSPSFSPVLKQLTYIHEENLSRSEFGGSEFGGYPSLLQRNDSYDIRESMNVHCGFVRGIKPGRQTGFDIDDSDLLEMEQCRGIVVASAIFGAYDLIQQPTNISEAAKENVCFFMFVDEETELFLRNSSQLDNNKKLGLWRTVVVHNLPYTDPRRTGKIPKLLLHRLFPNVRFSLWIDGKLQLVVDPYQILERFLWRKNASFAISRHYKRFDVFLEGEANKAAGKYDNASIDFQTEFYKMEGLTPYSEAKLPITSDVPEGCVIIREHIPISNLFTCLWFHEVDRFTSRDQISFAIVRDKIVSKTNWTINMFLDCERRNFVVQGYHRDVLEHWAPPPPPGSTAIVHPPPPFVDQTPNKTTPKISTEVILSPPIKQILAKRGKEKKSISNRHRKVAAGSREISSR
ncbi:probable hexosyltransferase MUCI70 [Rhododendron vialii]|uniref:probable hexosyltransferase MUCI70 n=1 Tax=Rhododendron vialii TaxID=182163 RepID=UPI00265E4294|nr:probable hexosyltransferase MUCI70 [Rhododendron vialii]XP_058201971.1 probable hexosyltransferase MUCI70 [Rhododendron vialii]XP_058201972.1 probable hexosyltransferase MUCI70 [Rhododendron vialii]